MLKLKLGFSIALITIFAACMGQPVVNQLTAPPVARDMVATQYPLSFLGSLNWKLTLPINNAQEIKVGGSPDLRTYSDEWFKLNPASTGVVFTAPTNGDTTANSSNPRSELREMTADGKTNASWSSTSGSHSMLIVQSVDQLNIGNKPIVVAGQIHDVGDDITVFRIEGSLTDRTLASIWITNGNTSHGHLLTDKYHLGDKFTVGFSVSNGKVFYTFNGTAVNYTLSKSFSGAYFKAGSYNQSGGNCTKLPNGRCDITVVTIYQLQVCHNGTCKGNLPLPTPTATQTATALPTPTAQPTVTPVVITCNCTVVQTTTVTQTITTITVTQIVTTAH